MADEMYAVSGETLVGLANAIRLKTGSDEMLTVTAMARAIDEISCGNIKSAEVSITLQESTEKLSFDFPHKPLWIHGASTTGFTRVAKTIEFVHFNGVFGAALRTNNNGNGLGSFTSGAIFRGTDIYTEGKIQVPCYNGYPFAANDMFKVELIYMEE